MSVGDTHEPVTVEGKNAVVIGGTSGIGRGFAAEGADVVATSRDEGWVAETAAELRELGATTTEITTDFRDPEAIEELEATAREELGGVDVLVNSAGAVSRAPVTELSEEGWARDVDVCLTGVFRAIKAFGATMESGSIVTISSMSADQIRHERPGYCAAKAGVEGLTRAASADLAPEIRVNAIAPGFIQTPITAGQYAEGTEKRERIEQRAPTTGVGETQDVVGVAIYLASDAAAFTTGEVITVDGGYDGAAI